MKKKIIRALIVMLMMIFGISPNTTAFSATNNKNHELLSNYTPPEHSIEEAYQDILFTIIAPYLERSVNEYYSKYLNQDVRVDPMSIKILDIQRPNGYRTFYFKIKLEIMPYIGPHNAVGLDHSTITVSGSEVKVVDFQHIESYPLPLKYYKK